MKVLLPKVKPFLYKNGGPIIMVQVIKTVQCVYKSSFRFLNLSDTFIGMDEEKDNKMCTMILYKRKKLLS